jgi:hypothetical protein
MSHNVLTKLYDNVVWHVIAYGAAIWGEKSYSCIDAVQYRAMRFFLGVGQYTPNNAVTGDMAWVHPIARQWTCVNNFIVRISNMDNDRLNKRVYKHLDTISNYRCRNWNFRIKTQLRKIDCDELVNHIDTGMKKKAVNDKVHTYLMNNFLVNMLSKYK